MFTFFLLINKTGLITFCGSNVEDRNKIVFDPNGDDVKYCFRKFENGQYKEGVPIVTRHPNILKSVLIGKRGWGLFVNEWSLGIAEGSFLKREILEEFSSRKIDIPRSLFIDFENRIYSFIKIKNNPQVSP